jgi:hypothetical protein
MGCLFPHRSSDYSAGVHATAPFLGLEPTGLLWHSRQLHGTTGIYRTSKEDASPYELASKATMTAQRVCPLGAASAVRDRTPPILRTVKVVSEE